MSGPDPRPEAVERAAEWIAQHGARYSPEALRDRLAAAGYTAAEIDAARAAADRMAAGGPATDLRGRAAATLIVGFLAVWGLVSVFLLRPGPPYTTGWWLVGILTAVLGIIALISLAVISESGRLRRGAEGALVAVLTIPFILLFIVAGLCVMTTGGGQA